MTSYYRDELAGLPEMGVVAGSCGGRPGSTRPTSGPPCSTTTSRRTC